MANLIFTLSGSAVATVHSDHIPPAGSVVNIWTDSYKKGLRPGSLIEFTVASEEKYCDPVRYEFHDGELTVYFDVNGYEVLKEGPPLED